MVVPGEAKFIKEFFEVSLILENMANPEFAITEAKTELKLPDGLVLASTRESQELVVNIGDILGGKNKEIKKT